MNAMWSEAKTRVSHRLAAHLGVGPFRLRNKMAVDLHRHGPEIGCGQAQTYNGWLILCTVAQQPSAYRCSHEPMSRALEAATKRRIAVLNLAEALPCTGI